MGKGQKSNLNDALLIIIFICLALIVLDYLMVNNDIFPSLLSNVKLLKILFPVYKYALFIRIIFVILLVLFGWFVPSFRINKETKKEHLKYWIISAVLLSLVFIVGFININFYDKFIFPLWIIVLPYVITKAVTPITQLNEAGAFFGLNKKEGSCSVPFKVITKEGKQDILVMPKAEYHTMVDGATGSGKSESVIKSFISHLLSNGYAGVIYDFNGDPLETSDKNDEKNPILTRVAYSALLRQKEVEGRKKAGFAFINFTDMRKTNRVNVLDRKYVRNELMLNGIATALMKNLEPSWKEKTDFWANNAISYVYAIALMFWKHFPEYCDLPHVISTCLYNHDAVFKWLSTDDLVCEKFKAMFSAWKLKADGQTAGAISSAQLPISKLSNPEIFWVLSCPPEDALDLNLTNKEKPVLLCLGNSPANTESISPLIAVISLICQGTMNRPGGVKSVFVYDEFPTVVLYKFSEFLATARKFKVCALLGVQNFEQAVINYGRDTAENLRATVGNIFQGLTRNLKTGEFWSNMIGTIKLKDVSYSENVDNLSTSERLQNEKVLQPGDIMSQPIGHFTGVLAGGSPPFFHTQFAPYEFGDQEVDIPDFSLPKVTGKQEEDEKILEKMVQLHFSNIRSEVKTLLSPYELEEKG